MDAFAYPKGDLKLHLWTIQMELPVPHCQNTTIALVRYAPPEDIVADSLQFLLPKDKPLKQRDKVCLNLLFQLPKEFTSPYLKRTQLLHLMVIQMWLEDHKCSPNRPEALNWLLTFTSD